MVGRRRVALACFSSIGIDGFVRFGVGKVLPFGDMRGDAVVPPLRQVRCVGHVDGRRVRERRTRSHRVPAWGDGDVDDARDEDAEDLALTADILQLVGLELLDYVGISVAPKVGKGNGRVRKRRLVKDLDLLEEPEHHVIDDSHGGFARKGGEGPGIPHSKVEHPEGLLGRILQRLTLQEPGDLGVEIVVGGNGVVVGDVGIVKAGLVFVELLRQDVFECFLIGRVREEGGVGSGSVNGGDEGVVRRAAKLHCGVHTS